MTRLDTSGRRDHFLYRLFDAKGRLLYIGATRNPRARRLDHQRYKSWWSEVTSWRMTGPLPQSVAWQMEAQAISEELPIHNALHTGRPIHRHRNADGFCSACDAASSAVSA